MLEKEQGAREARAEAARAGVEEDGVGWQGPSCRAVEARVRLREALRMSEQMSLPGPGTGKPLTSLLMEQDRSLRRRQSAVGEVCREAGVWAQEASWVMSL